jgi:His-Xaa-Ser system protein HxsD
MNYSIKFSSELYSAECLKKSAYKYIDKFSLSIQPKNGQFECELNFEESLSQNAIEQIVDDFKKEILDQDLRQIIKKETEPVRNLILAHTFSKTGLISDE